MRHENGSVAEWSIAPDCKSGGLRLRRFESVPAHMKKIIIAKNDSNQRIDKFLVGEFFSYTRGEIIRQIKNGNILVNEKKIKPSYFLKEEDRISVNFEEIPEELVPDEKVDFEIIYEDENIIVINKPAGLKVHPAKLPSNEKTLVNGLLHQFPQIKNVGDDPKIRPGIVHRLDRDTSGAMVIAKNQAAFLELKKKFKNREVMKKYWTLVYGKLENKSGIIEKPIARSASYKKQIIAGKKTKTVIRSAVTGYKVIREFGECSLLEVSPKTGRMHQIRIHLFSIGNPVLGDKIYKKKNLKKMIMAKRQMLHAKHIRFSLFGKEYDFTVEIPADFGEVLEFLTKSR